MSRRQLLLLVDSMLFVAIVVSVAFLIMDVL